VNSDRRLISIKIEEGELRMAPEDILALTPRLLTQAQREFYFENGYLLLERIIPEEWIEKLRHATDEVVEQTRQMTLSDAIWDLEKGHSSAQPRLRRLSSPVDHHATYWRYVSESLLGDIAADLLGPDVMYHHTKLNFKAPSGGMDVKWHQDIQFWPHTNYSPLTIGTYLYDCSPEQGPLGVIPGSHKLPLFDLYDDLGNWTGHLNKADLATLDTENAQYLSGPAGSVTIHNCRTIHGSAVNKSNSGRPLFLTTLSSADALPYTHNPISTPNYNQAILRGKRARWAHHDPRPCQMPPDWSGGYTSIFDLQQKSGSTSKM
jgi:ectoine hydroxylase